MLFNGKKYIVLDSVSLYFCSNSIHPRFKKDVAYRLVLGARAVAYGEKGVSFQGPFPAKIQFDQSSILSIIFDQEISATNSNNAFEVQEAGFTFIAYSIIEKNTDSNKWF